MERQRRLVGVDLGITSAHTVRVLAGDGSELCRRKCEPTVESLEVIERVALAGAPEGTRLEVVMEPTGPAWLPVAVFFARRGHTVYRVSSAKAAALRRFLHRHAKSNGIDAATLARLPLVDPEGLPPCGAPRGRPGEPGPPGPLVRAPEPPGRPAQGPDQGSGAPPHADEPPGRGPGSGRPGRPGAVGGPERPAQGGQGEAHRAHRPSLPRPAGWGPSRGVAGGGTGIDRGVRGGLRGGPRRPGCRGGHRGPAAAGGAGRVGGPRRSPGGGLPA